jgi:RNA polymerase sigma factor (TIGR02999 family)
MSSSPEARTRSKKVNICENRPEDGGERRAGHLEAGVDWRILNHADDATALLQAWGRGEAEALDRLLPLVHGELRRLAGRHMHHERAGHTLQASALVNEAYLRLIEVRQIKWQNRAHFFAMASRVMRRILVDAARARQSQKRDTGGPQLSFDDAVVAAAAPAPDFLALDDALHALEAVDPRKCKMVEMRFFGGMSVEETAAALHLSVGTIKRDWRLAKAWLARELGGSRRDDA